MIRHYNNVNEVPSSNQSIFQFRRGQKMFLLLDEKFEYKN